MGRPKKNDNSNDFLKNIFKTNDKKEKEVVNIEKVNTDLVNIEEEVSENDTVLDYLKEENNLLSIENEKLLLELNKLKNIKHNNYENNNNDYIMHSLNDFYNELLGNSRLYENVKTVYVLNKIKNILSGQ